MASSMRVISLKQFKTQWALAINKYTTNLWNFEVSVGAAAVQIFRDSFKMRRFNTSNSPAWIQRSKKNKGNFTVGSLIESGALRSSIEYKLVNGGVTIFTNPAAFSRSFRHRGFCYAAVHNEADGTRTGPASYIPQRQFMGHSTVLDQKMEELEAIIFKNLPK